MSLENRVVVITGGGSGIGADAAKAAVNAGAKLFLNGRSAAKLAAIASSIDPTSERVA